MNGYRVKVWDKNSLVVDNFYEIHQKAIALAHFDSYRIHSKLTTDSHYDKVALIMVNERVEKEYVFTDSHVVPKVVRIP